MERCWPTLPRCDVNNFSRGGGGLSLQSPFRATSLVRAIRRISSTALMQNLSTTFHEITFIIFVYVKLLVSTGEQTTIVRTGNSFKAKPKKVTSGIPLLNNNK